MVVRGDALTGTAALTRGEAERVAWLCYGSEEPAVVELLLLSGDPGRPRLKRLAAEFALTWFDPRAELPVLPPEEDLAVRVVRQLGLGRDLATRERAAARLVRLLNEEAA